MKTVNISKTERATSIGLGIVLAASGINHMIKSPCLFLLKCIAGYHLIQVGKTGYSPINDWLEINTDGQTPKEVLMTYKECFTGKEEMATDDDIQEFAMQAG